MIKKFGTCILIGTRRFEFVSSILSGFQKREKVEPDLFYTYNYLDFILHLFSIVTESVKHSPLPPPPITT